MLIVVWYLVPGLFLFGVVGSQGLVEDLVVDLFQIIVAVGHILLRPAPVYIRRKKLPVIVADTAWAHHAGYGCTDKITRPFYRPNLLQIPSYHSPRKGATPLCYFLRGESNAKALSHCRPVGAGSMKVLLRAPAGDGQGCQGVRFPATPGLPRLGLRPRRLQAAPPETGIHR